MQKISSFLTSINITLDSHQKLSQLLHFSTLIHTQQVKDLLLCFSAASFDKLFRSEPFSISPSTRADFSVRSLLIGYDSCLHLKAFLSTFANRSLDLHPVSNTPSKHERSHIWRQQRQGRRQFSSCRSSRHRYTKNMSD